jgi:organic radical activating enzyme
MKTSYERTKELIKDIAPKSFCAAKWYNVSIWLGNGRTASCHHPLAHPVPKKELEKSASALHNTQFKKEQRKKMLEGERPAECGYCWKVEDAAQDEDINSDRIYQTARYTEEEIKALKDIPWDKNVNPKTVEICFDNLCNLACSYCNSEFSSTWSKDIVKNGEYKNMVTDGGKTYRQDGSIAMPFGNKNEGNIYVKRFFDWFPEIKDGITELRVSGGEPSRSPSFWKLIDMSDNEKFALAVNSNLIMEDSRLDRLVEAGKKFEKLDIYTSAECMYKNQEFVRDGFDWDIWEKNVKKAVASPHINGMYVMMTISLLGIWTVDKFVKQIVEWKKEVNDKHAFFMSVNILRFPSFQSVTMLPQTIKEDLANRIEKVMKEEYDWINDLERNQLKRLLIYLRRVDSSMEDVDAYSKKRNDLINFVDQYAVRRNKPVEEYMPQEFNNWYQQLKNEE